MHITRLNGRSTLAAGLALLLALGAFGSSQSPLAAFQATSPQGIRPQAADAQGAALPRVVLYATGGTISNRTGSRLSVQELLDSMPGIARVAKAEGEQFANVSSGQITLQQWLDLSRKINEKFRSDAGLAGIVVTSGTDTLEEMAYFLHLTIRDDRPVVIVGSMRNPSTTGYEGVANLEDAFRVAADPASKGMGALVVLNDEINSARDATKTDARLLNTFTSRSYGVIGTVFDRVAYVRKPVKRHTAWSEFDVFRIETLPRVDVVLTYQEAPGDIIKAVVDAGARGVIIAGAGAGATSGTQGEGIRYASEKNVWIVSTTRTGSGSAGAGGGRGGSRRIGGDDLQPVKARILLMLALATTDDVAEVARMFREY